MGKNQHVTPHKDGGWQVKGENNTRATIRTDTQAEAIQRAREIARNQESELFIHVYSTVKHVAKGLNLNNIILPQEINAMINLDNYVYRGK